MRVDGIGVLEEPETAADSVIVRARGRVRPPSRGSTSGDVAAAGVKHAGGPVFGATAVRRPPSHKVYQNIHGPGKRRAGEESS